MIIKVKVLKTDIFYANLTLLTLPVGFGTPFPSWTWLRNNIALINLLEFSIS